MTTQPTALDEIEELQQLAGDQGWQELAGELMPGSIGAEPQEMEETV